MTPRRCSLLRSCVLAVAAASLLSCGSGSGTTATPAEGIMRLAVVGDSITTGAPNQLDIDAPAADSWVQHAIGEGMVLTGGWARRGATTAQMAQAVEPVDADLLVVLAGTNDVLSGVPFDQTAANISAIVETVAVARVVISSVPPIDADPEAAVTLNADLQALATARQWEWVDAADVLRTEDNEFRPGATSDGLHPSASGAAALGAALNAAITGGK